MNTASGARWCGLRTSSWNESGVRHCHCRWRFGGLRAGQPAFGPRHPRSPVARSWRRHAAGPRTARAAGQLRGPAVLQPALRLAGSACDDSGALARCGRGQPGAAAQVHASARARRWLRHQRPVVQSRRSHRLRRVGGTWRCGLGMERCASVLPQGGARPGLRWPPARQRGPHTGQPRPACALDGAVERLRRCLQGCRLPLPARPERRVRRRLFSGGLQQPGRAPCFGCDGLSGCRCSQTPQPESPDPHACDAVAF
ncbi:hypothetical protein D3C86_1327380 [compost metagenome]